MRVHLIDRFVRRVSRHGALDNVAEVLARRAAVDAELDAFATRLAPPPVGEAENPAAA
jgi:hypothetical protein